MLPLGNNHFLLNVNLYGKVNVGWFSSWVDLIEYKFKLIFFKSYNKEKFFLSPDISSTNPHKHQSFDLAEMSSITAKATRDTFCDCCLFASSK